jgi:Leucine-rich repeat (LRR) protein
MKFKADNVEYWSQNQVETVFFGNEEKALALTLSSIPGTTDHYLEWNDQSNACVNGIDTIQVSGEALHVRLLPKAAQQLGETEFTVAFECDEGLFSELLRCLKLIFPDKLVVKQTATKQKTAPKEDYSKIKYLNLEGKKLQKLPDYVSEMSALETAKLGYNPQLDFQAVCEVLANCPKLKELAITTESTIPENLGKLAQLETLHIDGLSKSCSFPESIGQLKKLKYLFVMGDSEVVLPESFAELVDLENLYMRVPSLQLPSKFYQLSKLTQLDFSNCRIRKVPEEMAGMDAVETLIFGGSDAHDFAQILPIVARMQHVKVLEMNANPVPKEIGLCKNIEELNIWTGLDPNSPLQLPDELFELTQLQTLMLSMNYFGKIPEGIGRLKGLKSLVFQEAVFESLPESIGELSNLELLNISENPALKSLPSSLGKLTQLKDLYLDDNPQLTELPPGLDALQNLTSVRISNRETMKNIPEAWNKLFTTV